MVRRWKSTDPYPQGRTFGELLDWHLWRGTRPEFSKLKKNPRWEFVDFAQAIHIGVPATEDPGTPDKKLRDWRKGRHLPNNDTIVQNIFEQLFGNDHNLVDWKHDLHEALERERDAKTASVLKRQEPTDTQLLAGRWALSNVPVLVPRHFIGREDIIQRLDTINASTPHAVVALHGIAGVGKTSLAAAYADLRRSEFIATWWIRAHAVDSIADDLKALARALGWADEESNHQQVLDRISNEAQPILLIFDNGESARSLAPYIPRGGRCLTLITTNSPNWRAIAETVELDCWEPDVGASYLIGRTDRVGEWAAAVRLSRQLGGLPLAHEQAASYCEHLRVGFEDYLMRLNSNPMELLGDGNHAATEYHGGETLARTVRLALEAASKMHSGAYDLFCLVAAMPAGPLPLFPLQESTVLSELEVDHLTGQNLKGALSALQTYGLIYAEKISVFDTTTRVDTVRFHGLVHSLGRAMLPEDELTMALVIWYGALIDVYELDLEEPLPDDRLSIFSHMQLELGTGIPLRSDEYIRVALRHREVMGKHIHKCYAALVNAGLAPPLE